MLIHDIIHEKGLILDYNDYCNPTEGFIDEGQVKIKIFDH